ncbi:MAG: hypothetical protein EBU40_12790, partial [Proteobacteria bacterium]|nr:hypothetical protein [Pseudomonadota bacterium]
SMISRARDDSGQVPMYASTSGEGEAADWCGMVGGPDMSTMVDRTGRTASTPDMTRRSNGAINRRGPIGVATRCAGPARVPRDAVE